MLRGIEPYVTPGACPEHVVARLLVLELDVATRPSAYLLVVTTSVLRVC